MDAEEGTTSKDSAWSNKRRRYHLDGGGGGGGDEERGGSEGTRKLTGIGGGGDVWICMMPTS